MKRALKSAETADIKIIMFDIENIKQPDKALVDLIDENTIVLINKVDLESTIAEGTISHCEERSNPIPISLKQSIGLDLLLQTIAEKAETIARPNETPGITRERHRRHLQEALAALDQCNIKDDLVLATEDIRIAIRHLSTLTGKIEVEEILGEIFSKFCIGK
jgi:tRNA modification GTPase